MARTNYRELLFAGTDMNEEMIYFPQYINNFNQIAFWEADDTFPFLAGCASGIFVSFYIEHVLVYIAGGLFGIVGSMIYIRSKRNHLQGVFFHRLYRWGFFRLNEVFKYGLLRKVVN